PCRLQRWRGQGCACQREIPALSGFRSGPLPEDAPSAERTRAPTPRDRSLCERWSDPAPATASYAPRWLFYTSWRAACAKPPPGAPPLRSVYGLDLARIEAVILDTSVLGNRAALWAEVIRIV